MKSTTAPSVPIRPGSTETLPEYSSDNEEPQGSLQDTTSSIVDTNGKPSRRETTPTPPSKREFLGKLKEKMIVSKADLEAEQQQKEIHRQQYLARIAKRREAVAEEQKNGGTWIDSLAYPTTSIFGG
ncbi:hypothetical protein K438DRAFT_1953645 [Mycena galopus ATCC 62051]|nr:hypothetical protein K438DRAFT_1953645 [Mycena galopus ATCC 62051]